jgi:hypothetical protein
MTTLARALALCAVCVVGLVAGSVATAGSTPTSPCTYGEAQHSFQAPYTSINPDIPYPFGNECQYRLFRDGETVTFCEDDFILGGVIWFADYPVLDMSRQEAIADIELNEDHVWIDGVEMPLMDTGIKDGQHPFFGKVVYKQRAFIAQLSVGEHTSYYENFHPDYGLFTSTVHLVVLPGTDPACS